MYCAPEKNVNISQEATSERSDIPAKFNAQHSHRDTKQSSVIAQLCIYAAAVY